MRVFIGWDPRETLAYRVAEKSLRRRCDYPGLQVSPLKLTELPMLTRPVERRDGRMWDPVSQAPMSTEFAVSRFCVPFLQRDGWALFVDCDVVFKADVRELFALADARYAIQVVKHAYQPREAFKMDGQVQTSYKCKNWSSVVLWNCGHPAHARLTKPALNTWLGRDLHAFQWLKGREIGKLPATWNHLVGVSRPAAKPKLLHYTLGGPWIPSWPGGPMDEEWIAELTEKS